MVCLCSLLRTLLLTSSPVTPQIDWDANNSAMSCAFSGNDLTNSLAKPKDCHDLCVSTPDCTHYTWTDFNSGTCWLKTNKVSKTEAFVKQDQNAVFGIVDGLDEESPVDGLEWTPENSALRYAFSGNDLTNAPSKSGDCHDLCASTESCSHYTWTDYNSGTCWMKTNSVGKKDAILKHDQNALCGIVGDSSFESTSASETIQLNSAVEFTETNSVDFPDSNSDPFPGLNSFPRWESFPTFNSLRKS